MNKFRELSTGKVLYNKYVIEKVLGVGGFGITYYAKHTKLNKHYAIKEFFINGSCVRSTQSKDVHLQGITEEKFEKYKRKFEDEGETLAKIDHPNVVKVIDIFEENSTSYIVMQFVEGITLQQLVEQRGKLDYETAVNYIAQIAEAVGHIHSLTPPILHRDISPDNVIITPANKIVLIDFGSAREFINNQTQDFTAILKKGYAPFEQYAVTSRKGAYSDIYSLGAVFYFALTGKKPMEAPERMVEDNDNMPEPKSLDASIPEDANRTILKAMALRPENRHQDIKEFMDDLLGEKPSKPVRKTVPKNRKKIVAVSLCLIAVLLIGAAVWAWLEHNESTKTESDFQQYRELVNQAEKEYSKGEDCYVAALEDYTKAAGYEMQYADSKNAGKFNLEAQLQITKIEAKIDSIVHEYSRKADLFKDCDRPDCFKQLVVFYEKIMTVQPDNNSVKEELERYKNLLNK
jgi:serine/threonine protein kinase